MPFRHLTDVWHGANWNFIIWGVYFGILLLIEKFFLLKFMQKLPSFLGHVYTMLLVIISWAIFAIEDMGKLGKYLGAMFGAGGSFLNSETLYLLVSNALLFVIFIIAATPLPKFIAGKVMAKLGDGITAGVVQNAVLVGIFLLSTAYLVASTYNPFLYFRF